MTDKREETRGPGASGLDIAGDDALAALIVREQKGFRGTLFAGVAALLVMTLVSAALGAYLYTANDKLSRTIGELQAQAFTLRRAMDGQRNQISGQERTLRGYYADIRNGGRNPPAAPGDPAGPAAIASARLATKRFLEIGRIPDLGEQRLITGLSEIEYPGISPTERAIFTGTAALTEFLWRNEPITRDAAELPPLLREAETAFNSTAADPAMVPLAGAGLARIRFTDASSARNNFSELACASVYEAIETSGSLAPLPLYWRAQCERKTGRTGAALADYARALGQSLAIGTGDNAGEAELTLAMNAFHGLGTTLVAGALLPEATPEMREALAIAKARCGTPDPARSPRMGLAVACLGRAMELRRRLGQTANQISGSAENIGFALLRDNDYNAAWLHSVAIERTGLFPWNEILRALTASKAGGDAAPSASRAASLRQALLNMSLFEVEEFNLCELRALLGEQDFAEARKLIARTHPGKQAECIS